MEKIKEKDDATIAEAIEITKQLKGKLPNRDQFELFKIAVVIQQTKAIQELTKTYRIINSGF